MPSERRMNCISKINEMPWRSSFERILPYVASPQKQTWIAAWKKNTWNKLPQSVHICHEHYVLSLICVTQRAQISWRHIHHIASKINFVDTMLVKIQGFYNSKKTRNPCFWQTIILWRQDLFIRDNFWFHVAVLWIRFWNPLTEFT